MWRSPVVTTSDNLFTDIVYNYHKKEFYDIGNRVKSSLPLQISFYFNVWLLPVWFIINLYNLDLKYYNLSDIYKFITVAVFIAASTLESTRLYLGYFGNLAEKIPELATFWLISTLLQLPLELFLIFDSKTLPHFSERIVNSLALFLLILEIILGTITLKSSAEHHAKRFYISRLYEVEDKMT